MTDLAPRAVEHFVRILEGGYEVAPGWRCTGRGVSLRGHVIKYPRVVFSIRHSNRFDFSRHNHYRLYLSVCDLPKRT